MFGLSFFEIVVVLLVAIVVVGPRQLPSMVRTLSQWLVRLRRAAYDMRTQSGIDEILRDEGLVRDLQELRQLLRIHRAGLMEALTVDAEVEMSRPVPAHTPEPAAGASPSSPAWEPGSSEYPTIGCDAYGALSEDLAPYAQPEVSSTKAAQTEEPTLPSHPPEA